MRRIFALLAASALAAPALARPAQDPHAGHHAEADAQADPHAGHAMPEPEVQTDPHAGHAMEEAGAQPDPHAGHAMPQAPADPDPHAGHAVTEPAVPAAPPPAEALAGPEHAANLVFGAERMAEAREELRETHGDILTSKLMIERLEARIRGGEDGYAWDAQFWWGGDTDKIWLKTEGEGAFGEAVEAAEIQALWSRAIDPWFDLQLGLRHDLRPDPERSYLVAGVQGLAPYWFELDGVLFLSDQGDLSARLEGEYDLRLTRRLIAQPRAEVEIALQDVPELEVGAGLSNAELGLRLRYEIEPEFAPYVGIEYGRGFGETADFRRAAGEDIGGWSLLLGIRAWF